MPDPLLILGASTRAAAFSALRVGLEPCCVDLFADADLEARCPVTRLPGHAYPRGFRQAADAAPPGPWLYTGGLENRPIVVMDLGIARPLWGTHAVRLAQVRSPFHLARALRAANIPCPAVRARPGNVPGRWLLKPRASAGGAGIRFYSGQRIPRLRKTKIYLQEYIEGDSCAAIYLGDGEKARLLGVTRQLVGERWLHAGPFHYCGSIGPLAPSPSLHQAFGRLGNALALRFELQGIFGVDCVVRDDVPWPVEVNPRYTASVEVLEHALGIAALALHRQVFEPAAPAPPRAVATGAMIGKAILFARAPLTFPAAGPWLPSIRRPGLVHKLPAFADIPPAGREIGRGRPILTLFARASSAAGCLDRLKETAADLDRWLFGT